MQERLISPGTTVPRFPAFIPTLKPKVAHTPTVKRTVEIEPHAVIPPVYTFKELPHSLPHKVAISSSLPRSAVRLASKKESPAHSHATKIALTSSMLATGKTFACVDRTLPEPRSQVMKVKQLNIEAYQRQIQTECTQLFSEINLVPGDPRQLIASLTGLNQRFNAILRTKIASPKLKDHIQASFWIKEFKDRFTDIYFQNILFPRIYHVAPELQNRLHFMAFHRIKNPHNNAGASLRSDIDTNLIFDDRDIIDPLKKNELQRDIERVKQQVLIPTKQELIGFGIDLELDSRFSVRTYSQVLEAIKNPESQKFYASIMQANKTYPGARIPAIDRLLFNDFMIPGSSKRCIQYFTDPLSRSRLAALATPRANWRFPLKESVRVLDLLTKFPEERLSEEERDLLLKASLFTVLETLSSITPDRERTPDYTKLTASQFTTLMNNPNTREVMISIFQNFGLLRSKAHQTYVPQVPGLSDSLFNDLIRNKAYDMAGRLFFNRLRCSLERNITPSNVPTRRNSIIVEAMRSPSLLRRPLPPNDTPLSDPSFSQLLPESPSLKTWRQAQLLKKGILQEEHQERTPQTKKQATEFRPYLPAIPEQTL